MYPMTDKENNVKNRLPTDWWKQQECAFALSGWFEKHIIALQVMYTINGKRRMCLFTGFLLFYQECHMWITAGHVLDELNKIIDSDDYNVHTVAWADNYQNSEAGSIFIDYGRLHKCVLRDEGLDLGIVIFGPLDLKAILSNSENKWFESNIWKNNHLAKPDGFYLVGYPVEMTAFEDMSEPNGPYDCRLNAYLVSNPVERIDPKEYPHTQSDFWNRAGCFYGKVLPIAKNDNQNLQSIEGMSGGPILSLEHTTEGDIKYRLFAIQSSWLPNCRILCGTPIDRVVQLIDKGFDFARSQLGNK